MTRSALVRLALLGALAAPTLAACGDDDAGSADGGPGDAGPPTAAQCAEDPLLPTCTPDERPGFEGLAAEVEILRDASGVVHVYAASDRDALYASGYMQAFDRLFQMDLNLRRALGTRAEVLGERYADEDGIARLFDIPRWARSNEAALFRDDPERWALVQAWVEGVNARIREVRADRSELPPEFSELGYEPAEWTVADGFAFGKMVLFGNSNQLESSILTAIVDRYLPALDARLSLTMPLRDAYVMPPEERPPSGAAARIAAPAGEPLPIPPDAAARIARFQETLRGLRVGGSNNWAVDGAHTESGRPLLAGDPHQPLQSPSLFWLHHMNSADAGGTLDVIGFNFVGAPGVHLGHNRRVAWTATTNYPDNLDLWDVRIGPGGGVMIGDREVPIITRSETIRVAGGAQLERVYEEVGPGLGVLLPADFAPLPIGRPGRRLLVNWTGFRVTHEFEGFLGFDTAADTDDFARAVQRVELGYFNFVFADARGIRYLSHPLVPDRGEIGARRPWALSDGDDPTTFWNPTFLDSARLPSSTGGSRGWIATANNDPWGFTENGRLDDDPWYFGAIYDPGMRAARIEDELARLVARGDVSVLDMQALQDDTHSILADELVPILEDAWATVGTDPMLTDFRDRADLDALVSALAAWDRRMERSSSEAVVFHAFSFFLARRVLEDDLPIVFEPLMSASASYVFKWLCNVLKGRAPDPESFFAGEARQLSIARALAETRDWLTERFGDAPYTWGDLHGTRFASIHGERLEGGWVATDGAEGTVNVSETSFFDGTSPRERLEATSGSIYRMVTTFGEDGTPQAFVNVPRGVSGDPESPHWDDLQSDWVENVYRPLLFRRADVEAGEHELMTLRP